MSQILAFEESLSQKNSDLRMNGATCNSKWYAAFTMPRHEKRVSTHCFERNIESFLPVYQVRHRWKNRCNPIVELPLFPNYFFVRIGLQERSQVLRIPGVLYIVSSGRELLPIADTYIDSLRLGLLTHRIEPHPNVEVGDRVCITRGPMAGMEGILERVKSGIRVVIKLEMIGRSVAVEVGAEDVTYVGPEPERQRLSSSYKLTSPVMVNGS